MTRRIFTLANQRLLDRCIECIREAYANRAMIRVEVKGPKRTNDQNGKLHAMLGDLAEQLTHYGQTLDVEDWKDVFMDELTRDHRMEARTARGLYGAGFVPLGRSTSDLDVVEFSDLIALVSAFGDSKGVIWSEPKGGDRRPAPPNEVYEAEIGSGHFRTADRLLPPTEQMADEEVPF